ncbi:MAG: ATP-binding protein [Nitrospinae bacterium]|nr:ATP-binding protein [Nitrospinota bacterium]
MIPKPIDRISKEDIDALVENGVAESKTLEYKESLPGNSDEDKKEFLGDASSFANAAGGDIVYGMKGKRDGNGKSAGTPEKAGGLPGINPDQEILRLEKILSNGVAPRIPGVHFQAINGFPQGPVIVLRIPKSWNSPHMVIFKNRSRFYSRASNGKEQLDVDQIRAAFALSESVGEKIRRFRDERIARIVAGETPLPMAHPTKVVLHVFPIESADPSVRIDVKEHFDEIRNPRYRPIFSHGLSWRYNFDGVLTYYNNTDSDCHSYLQVFRNRVLETAGPLSADQKQFGFPEDKLIEYVKSYLQLLKAIGANPPFVILLTLIGVKGLTKSYEPAMHSYFEASPIDRDPLMLPDVLAEDFDVKVETVLRPLFDMVWQACGWERSMNYNGNGEWTGGR